MVNSGKIFHTWSKWDDIATSLQPRPVDVNLHWKVPSSAPDRNIDNLGLQIHWYSWLLVVHAIFLVWDVLISMCLFMLVMKQPFSKTKMMSKSGSLHANQCPCSNVYMCFSRIIAFFGVHSLCIDTLSLRIQVWPKKGIIPTILLWGWDV